MILLFIQNDSFLSKIRADSRLSRSNKKREIFSAGFGGNKIRHAFDGFCEILS